MRAKDVSQLLLKHCIQLLARSLTLIDTPNGKVIDVRQICPTSVSRPDSVVSIDNWVPSAGRTKRSRKDG